MYILRLDKAPDPKPYGSIRPDGHFNPLTCRQSLAELREELREALRRHRPHRLVANEIP